MDLCPFLSLVDVSYRGVSYNRILSVAVCKKTSMTLEALASIKYLEEAIKNRKVVKTGENVAVAANF